MGRKRGGLARARGALDHRHPPAPRGGVSDRQRLLLAQRIALLQKVMDLVVDRLGRQPVAAIGVHGPGHVPDRLFQSEVVTGGIDFRVDHAGPGFGRRLLRLEPLDLGVAAQTLDRRPHRVPAHQRAERREGLLAVLDLQPVEGERGAVGQHGLARAPVAEGVVVDAERRAVAGLAHRDVERMVMVAGGEHRAPHLEQHEVEGRPEILRQAGFHQGGADGAEIVGKADADTGLLARLRLRVGPRGRHDRAGDGGRLDAGGGLLAVILPATVMRGGTRRGGVGIGRHVLGLHQPLDELQLAVAADGDDAPGDGNVLGLEDGAGLDGVLDLLEARLDGLGLLDQLVGPRVLVHVDELVVPGVQPLDLGLLLVGGLGRRGTHAPEAGEVGPLDVETGLGPLPPRRELVGGHLEPVQGELHQQRRVLQPDAVLVLVGEEVAENGTAGGLVGVHANVAGKRGTGGNAVIGEHALDLPAGGPVALVLDLLPHRHLARGVGGHGEGLEGFQVDGVLR